MIFKIPHEAFIHVKDKVYPNFYQKVCLFLYVMIIASGILIYLLFDKLGIEVSINWWLKLFISLAVILIVYFTVNILFAKMYGINWWGKISLKLYANYIINNYWMYITNDIEKKHLEHMLEQVFQQASLYQDIVDKALKNTKNTLQKKYLIETILSACHEEHFETIIINKIVPLLSKEEDEYFNYFIIIQIHLWNMNHKSKECVKIYLKMLCKVVEEEQLEKKVIYLLSEFIGNDAECQKELDHLKETEIWNTVQQRHCIRMKEYYKAEINIHQGITDCLKAQGKDIDFKKDSAQDIPQ